MATELPVVLLGTGDAKRDIASAQSRRSERQRGDLGIIADADHERLSDAGTTSSVTSATKVSASITVRLLITVTCHVLGRRSENPAARAHAATSSALARGRVTITNRVHTPARRRRRPYARDSWGQTEQC